MYDYVRSTYLSYPDQNFQVWRLGDAAEFLVAFAGIQDSIQNLQKTRKANL